MLSTHRLERAWLGSWSSIVLIKETESRETRDETEEKEAMQFVSKIPTSAHSLQVGKGVRDVVLYMLVRIVKSYSCKHI